MHQNEEFLGGLHPGKESDFPALRQAFGEADFLRVTQFNALRSHKLHQPFPVPGNLAFDFSKLGQFLAFGLADVLSRDLRPSLCALDVCRE